MPMPWSPDRIDDTRQREVAAFGSCSLALDLRTTSAVTLEVSAAS
jgi:hypothetical protein